MDTRIVLALALSSTALLGGQAKAQDVYDSTPKLMEACRNVETAKTWRQRFSKGERPSDMATKVAALDALEDARACYSYLWGYNAGYRGSLATAPLICFPAGITSDQLVAVFLAWANANPGEWNLPPGATTFMAFSDAWPCAAGPATKH